MGVFNINKKLLPAKVHYGLFWGGTSTMQPVMPIIAKKLGFSTTSVGTIYTILPILGLLIKPTFGAVSDAYKAHRAVLMISLATVIVSYFCVQFIPQLEESPNKSVKLSEQVHNFLVCPGMDSRPYLLSKNDDCTWICGLNNDLCAQWNLTTHCNAKILMDSCRNISHESSITIESKVCKKSCLHFVQAKDNENDNTNTLTDNEIYQTWQFWVFILLLNGAWGGTAVVTTISDTMCIEMCGDPFIFGYQRLWGSLIWGIVSIANGFVVDAFSTPGEEKNHTPAFYFMLVPLLFDLVLTYFMKIQIPQSSESIWKDVFKVCRKPKTIVFILWCTMQGVSFGLLWNFQLWLLEDLANVWGPDMVVVISTIEGLVIGLQCIYGEAPAFFFSGWILKKIGHFHTFSLIFLAIGVRFTLYSFLVNPWWTLPIEVLQCNFALFYSTMTSYAKEVSLPGTEATIQSIFCAACEGIGIAIGSFLGGLSYDAYAGSMTFRIFGITFLVLVIANEIIVMIFRIVQSQKR